MAKSIISEGKKLKRIEKRIIYNEGSQSRVDSTFLRVLVVDK